MRAYRRVTSSELGSVIVDSVDDGGAAAAAAEGAYTVRTDLGEVERTHNYRSNSGAERIAATVNRFDRFYTHDIVIAVPDDMPELQPFYMQALMYALATTEVGIATLVSPLENGELENDEIAKVAVNWNPDRIVYPLEGSRVGTLLDIRRDAERAARPGLLQAGSDPRVAARRPRPRRAGCLRQSANSSRGPISSARSKPEFGSTWPSYRKT